MEKSTAQKPLWIYIVMGLVISFTVFIRFRLLGAPLERDEGEYAYMGQLLLQGILPYTEAYNMKFPGIYFVYALILKIFGQTHTGIHLALVFVNIATSILFFFLGKRLFNNVVGVITASSFLILTLSPTVQGFWANSEHFVILTAIGGILLMLRALEKQTMIGMFLSGLLLGMTFLIKQHGIFFSLFGFIYLCSTYFIKRHAPLKKTLFSIGLFILGIITPFGLTIILFLVAGNFDKFWFWTFKYASEYATRIPISQGIAKFKWSFTQIIKPDFLIIIGSFIGMFGPIWNKTIRHKMPFFYGFFIASFLSICPGFYFRPHYFILLMSAIPLLAGIGVYSLIEKIKSSRTQAIVTLFIVVIFLSYPIVNQRDFLFKLSPGEACRATYGLNPFPESLKIADFINKNTDKNDRIAVLGSEPQIYFYSKRKAATGYVYTYALMEPHKFAVQMQKEMISEIESFSPSYIVFTNIPTSWLVRPNSEKLLLDWMESYIPGRYELSGFVDLISKDSIVYKWEDEIKGYSPRSKLNVYIFRKKT